MFKEFFMFTLVDDESSQNLGIEIHKKRRYLFETPFLAGNVWHDSTHRLFNVLVEPNYSALADLASGLNGGSIKHEFNTARTQTIAIGQYKSLDIVDDVVSNLENWYKEILQRCGANHRFLVTEGNSYNLVKSETASDVCYGDAIVQARYVQAFNMMHENKKLDHATVTGKIMPFLMKAVGFENCHVTHDLSPEGGHEVKFIVEEVGVFAFYQQDGDNKPAYMERYSYLNGDYYRSFAGETTGDVMKKFVFEWLLDAAQEKQVVPRADVGNYLEELILDIRSTWGSARTSDEAALFEDKRSRADNLISLAQYRLA